MAGNQQIPDLPAVPSPDGGDVYIVKTDTDYRVPVGEALGLATLGADGILSLDQRPTAEFATGSLIAGSGVTFTGTGTDKLVGLGDITISATATGASWGTITGTLSAQTDLNSALAAKAALSHTHAASDITSGTISTARLGSGTASTTTFLRGDNTWQTVSTGSANWGSISGTLSSQTDLQTALNAKSNTGHTHAASDIVSGTVATARLGTGTASSATYLRGDSTWGTPTASAAWGGITGTLSSQTDLQSALDGKAATVHTHAAADITSGVMASARLGSGTASSSTFLRGDGTWASTSTGAATWGSISGNLVDQTDLNTALAGKANTSHTHSGADIVSGTVAVARLGSGTPSTSTFLRGDGSWQSVSTGTAWGGITGTLSSQTDLQVALNDKAPLDGVGTSGTWSISITGNAASATYVNWAGVQSKPTTLSGYGITDAASLSHTHDAADITTGFISLARLGALTPSATNFLAGDGVWKAVEWDSVVLKPSTFTPSAHTHSVADITDFFDGSTYSVTLGSGSLVAYGQLYADVDKLVWHAGNFDPAAKANVSHTHAITDIPTLFDGTNYTMSSGSGNLSLGGNAFANGGVNPMWHSGNFDPTDYASLTAANTFTLNQTAPNFIATSDERLKYDIHTVEPRQRLADMLRFVGYIYTSTDEAQLGLIAQEVAEVAPEYVYVGEDGYLGIDKAGIALEAVIGLAARVQELEAKVA